MCSGTPMSGKLPSPLSVHPHNKGYFLLSSQHFIATMPSHPPPYHCSPLIVFCLLSSTCSHIWIAPMLFASLILSHYSLFLFSSSSLSSIFAPSSLHPIFLFLFIAMFIFHSELIYTHCDMRSLLPKKEDPMSSVLKGSFLYIDEVQRHKIQANHKSLFIDFLKNLLPVMLELCGRNNITVSILHRPQVCVSRGG